MNETAPNPDAVYPPQAHKYRLSNGTSITVPAPNSVLLRLISHLNERLGFTEDGRRNTTDDPFLADVAILVSQAAIAIGNLEVTASGAFDSTEDKPVYVGGVESASTQVFTPQGAAGNALAQIFALDHPEVKA